MKQAMNFRFSSQAVTTLSILTKKLHLSKTALLEQAIQSYAKKSLPKRNSLMEYAGVLQETEAEKILLTIKSNKHSKTIRADL